MAPTGPFDHLRHSALDLLDAGNSTAAVAEVLAVPASVLARWRDEAVPPRPEPDELASALAAHGKPIFFRSTLQLAPSALVRLGHLAYMLWIGVSVAAGAADSLHEGEASWTRNGLILVAGAFGFGLALAWLRRSHGSLVLGPNAMSVPTLFGRRSLAYADLADYWLVGHVKNEGTDDECEGRLLTLHSRRPGVPPLEVFVSDSQEIDPRVIERLDFVKNANQGVRPLTPIRSIPKP